MRSNVSQHVHRNIDVLAAISSQLRLCRPSLTSCRIQYDTGEIEELDLTEVIHDEQMYLIE